MTTDLRNYPIFYQLQTIISDKNVTSPSCDQAEVHLTFRPRSYRRALDVSPAVLAFRMAVLYMATLSSRMCWRLPGAAKETLVSCCFTYSK